MTTINNTLARYCSLIAFCLGGLFMGGVGIYTMHTKYGEICGEINWQSPMCSKIKEHW